MIKKNTKQIRKKQVKKEKIVIYIFLAFVTLCMGALSLYYDYKLKTNGTIIEATVYQIYQHKFSRTTLYSIDYTYQYKGVIYQGTHQVGSKKIRNRYKTGECVLITRCKDRPKINKMYSEWSFKCSDTDSSATP